MALCVQAENFSVDRLMYCSFEGNHVVIGMNRFVGTSCQQLVDALSVRLTVLDTSLKRSVSYSRYGRDRAYRDSLSAQLR